MRRKSKPNTPNQNNYSTNSLEIIKEEVEHVQTPQNKFSLKKTNSQKKKSIRSRTVSLAKKEASQNDTSQLLKNLTVYVDIKSDDANISEYYYPMLESLGANVQKHLNKKCNIMIWKGKIYKLQSILDGSMKNVTKAQKYNIKIVNSLWLQDILKSDTLPLYEKYKPTFEISSDLPFLLNQEKKRRSNKSSNQTYNSSTLGQQTQKFSDGKKIKPFEEKQKGKLITL